MPSKEPRPPACPWHRRARGATLMLCLWLAGASSAAASEEIIEARFAEPTTRYAHGVLGDDVEYGGLELRVETRGSDNVQTLRTIRLPQDRVFEDLSPRLVDMDSDGKPEVVVVESHAQLGAQLAIYDASGKKIAATPHIGTRFRWLAPIGAGDLDGDGYTEIAYIDRPHLAKTLRIWRYKEGALAEIASLPGLTNHRIGEDYISGGLRDCGKTPELIIASANWSRIISVTYDKGWTKSDLGPFTGRQSVNQALQC